MDNFRHSISIGSLDINIPLVLAPMSGVTTSAFRRLIKELNPGSVGLVITEFISVEGLTRESRKSKEMMRFRELERPFGIQIFGYDINRMRDAAIMAQDAGADLVDINCGCPAPKVVKRGGGCELMRQPDHLQQIFHAVRKALQIPLTMKMRSGWDEEIKNCKEIAHIVESEGVDAVTIHGRTRSQLYRGEADWNIVGEVVNTVKIPVFGSGDIVDRSSAEERVAKSGVKGVFIGRAAINNPYVFSEINKGITINIKDNESEMIKVVSRYAELLQEDFPPTACVGRIKQMVSQMCRKTIWAKSICRAMTLNEQLEILERAKEGTFKAVAL